VSTDTKLLADRRIALLLGGDSPEREISLLSGATIMAALGELDLSVVAIDPIEDGWWQQLAPGDLVFNCLHGGDGEGGAVQGLLQSMRLDYTGSDVAGSALAMSKLNSKRVWRDLGIPTAPFEVLTKDSDWEELSVRWPLSFVKPATGGSSLGMTRVETATGLRDAWQKASKIDSTVIMERFIAGPEYTVAILGDEALPPIRLETDNQFYDYQAKYFSDETRYLCPCGLAENEIDELKSLSMAAFKALGCEVWGRVDLMLDPELGFMVLETNTVPGMTSHSLVPMAARIAGYSIEQLVERILLLSADKALSARAGEK
jgi:D-alanine-D-alanine ligase